MNAIEATVAALWRAIFQINGVGRADDILDLHGDAVVASTPCVHDDFGVEQSVQDFFTCLTTSELAADSVTRGPRSSDR